MVMRNGVRINAVAPGVTATPMTDGVFSDETFGNAIKEFNEMTPFGSMAKPEMICKTRIGCVILSRLLVLSSNKVIE